MHRRVKDSVEIARPVEQVFAFVTDPGHWSQWSGPVIEVRSARPWPLTPDAVFTVVAKLVGRQFETESRVTDHEPSRLLAYQSTPSGVTTSHKPRGKAVLGPAR